MTDHKGDTQSGADAQKNRPLVDGYPSAPPSPRAGGRAAQAEGPAVRGTAAPSNLDIYGKSVRNDAAVPTYITEAERKRRRVFHRAISGIKHAQFRNEQVRFLTLTSKYNEEVDFQKGWRKFVWRVRRKYKKFEYLMIRELTSSELIHAHVLFRGYFLPHDWIVDTWKDLTGFEIVKIQLLQGDPRWMASYVSKYVSKEHLRYGWSRYWVFPRFAQVWQWVKRYTEYDIPSAIQLFDKILESGWLYWDRKLVKAYLESGDFTRPSLLLKDGEAETEG